MKEIQHEQLGWCGPAKLQWIAEQEGINVAQSELADLMSTTEADGTTHDDLVRGARKLGFEPTPIRGLDIEALGYLLKSYYVIVNWMDGDNDKTDGHYSILEEVNDKFVKLDDIELPIEEFIKKWYDVEKDGQRIDKWGMIISK